METQTHFSASFDRDLKTRPASGCPFPPLRIMSAASAFQPGLARSPLTNMNSRYDTVAQSCQSQRPACHLCRDESRHGTRVVLAVQTTNTIFRSRVAALVPVLFASRMAATSGRGSPCQIRRRRYVARPRIAYHADLTCSSATAFAHLFLLVQTPATRTLIVTAPLSLRHAI